MPARAAMMPALIRRRPVLGLRPRWFSSLSSALARRARSRTAAVDPLSSGSSGGSRSGSSRGMSALSRARARRTGSRTAAVRALRSGSSSSSSSSSGNRLALFVRLLSSAADRSPRMTDDNVKARQTEAEEEESEQVVDAPEVDAAEVREFLDIIDPAAIGEVRRIYLSTVMMTTGVLGPAAGLASAKVCNMFHLFGTHLLAGPFLAILGCSLLSGVLGHSIGVKASIRHLVVQRQVLTKVYDKLFDEQIPHQSGSLKEVMLETTLVYGRHVMATNDLRGRIHRVLFDHVVPSMEEILKQVPGGFYRSTKLQSLDESDRLAFRRLFIAAVNQFVVGSFGKRIKASVAYVLVLWLLVVGYLFFIKNLGLFNWFDGYDDVIDAEQQFVRANPRGIGAFLLPASVALQPSSSSSSSSSSIEHQQPGDIDDLFVRSEEE